MLKDLGVDVAGGAVSSTVNSTGGGAGRNGGGRRVLLMIFLTCFVPVVLAYLAYATRFFDGRNNYGTLLDPQVDVPSSLQGTLLGGDPFDIAALRGKWILFQVASGRCDENCQQMMFYQRQIRTSTGKEQGRLERVVFLIDDEPVETMLLRQFDGVHFVRVKAEQLQGWLPLPNATQAAAVNGNGSAIGSAGQSAIEQLQRHVFMADPLGHLMMRFPDQPDWAKVRKDISKLLWNSKIG